MEEFSLEKLRELRREIKEKERKRVLERDKVALQKKSPLHLHHTRLPSKKGMRIQGMTFLSCYLSIRMLMNLGRQTAGQTKSHMVIWPLI